jgi:methylenetetrahydrofolate reductase (NADPH)
MTPSKEGVTFRQMLTGAGSGGGFYYGAELVTTRGIAEPGKPHKLVELGEALASDPRIGWISVTDNPGGNPMLPPDWLGRILAGRRVQVVVHLTCKDLNRNGIESAAWGFAAEGFNNILALTGDYPMSGYGGVARPVFDLDSVAVIALLRAMNLGLKVPGRKGDLEALPATGFFIGAAVSPFKRHERELMPQLFKLARKVRCGAQWVIPQLGYDMRKFHEVKLFLDWAKLPVPLVGNVYVLNKTVAGLFNQNKIPGCVVSDALLAQVRTYAAGPDKGAKFFQELAAKQLAVFKGLGYAAGYLAGAAKADTFTKIIDLAESYAPDDWKAFAKELQFPQDGEFYLFEQDPQTGLGVPGQLNRGYLESLKNPEKSDQVTLGYRLSRRVHSGFFTPGQGQFPRMQRLYARLEKHKDGVAIRALHSIEQVSKTIGYGCKDCGDCSLPDCAYLCPNDACSKGARNGPCGGSFDGTCERGDKPCLWTRAYERLKHYGESEHMLDGGAVFTDGQLLETSSWANMFLGRDHHHAALSAPPPPLPVGEGRGEGRPATAPAPGTPGTPGTVSTANPAAAKPTNPKDPK